MPRLSQRGVIHLFLPILLLLGVVATVFLVTSGNPLKLFSRASNPPIVFKNINSQPLPTSSPAGIPQSTSATVRIEITSPLGGPESGGPSSPISSPTQTKTSAYRFAETPNALDSKSYTSYTQHPTLLNYAFIDPSVGSKFIWVDFKGSNGAVERRSAQIEIISTASPSPTPTPTPSASSQRVFVTSTNYQGNFGGLAGADAKCQERANAANLGGTWKAWLSDGTNSAASRVIQSSGPYKLLNEAVIANNWTDLTDESILHNINITENKDTQRYGVYTVWTSTTGNGSISSSALQNNWFCNNWQSTMGTGIVGISNTGDQAMNQQWTLGQTSYCNAWANLYCFEQTTASSSPTPTPTSSSSPDPYSNVKFSVSNISNNVSIAAGNRVKVFDVKAKSATYMYVTSDPNIYGSGISFTWQTSGSSLSFMQKDETVSVYLQANNNVTSRIYNNLKVLVSDSSSTPPTGSNIIQIPMNINISGINPTPTPTPTSTPTPSPKPDLIITSISPVSSSVKAGSWNYYKVIVKNQGTVTVNNSLSNIYMSITSPKYKGKNTSCQTGLADAIPAGQSITFELYCIAYDAGYNTFSAKVDNNNRITESNESNNTFTTKLYVRP